MDKDSIILVDFDHTLFDTSRFVEFLSKSPETINYKDFLYPDVSGFLDYASKLGKLTLFSEGEVEFQKEKIEGTGIGKLFPGGVRILPSYTKVGELAKMSDASETILIDDKPEIIDQAISSGFKVIRVKRGKYAGEDTKFKPNIEVESLAEIVKNDLLRNL